MHYNWNRFYDPNTGRYITQDPIGLKGGINRYAYVNGNPMFWMDPMGLIDIFIGGAADGTTRIVGNYQALYQRNNPERKSIYFEWGQATDILQIIHEIRKNNPCEPINLIGHSYGGSTAASVSQVLTAEGIKVDLLITIDPVSRIWTRERGNAALWVNLNATPAQTNSSDTIATIGGKWGDWPSDKANIHYDAPFNHADFKSLFEFTPQTDPSAKQLLQNAPTRSEECGCK